MSKVRLADLITVEPGTEKPMKWTNKIISKHVDFVLLDPANLKCLLVIELDDKSHDEPERQDRDGFVDQAFKAAGIKILHVPVQATYNTAQIKNQIDVLLK